MTARLLPAALLCSLLTGHVTRPLGRPIQQVVVIRRVSCGGARGFRVGNLHLFRTFTLPTYVDIG